MHDQLVTCCSLPSTLLLCTVFLHVSASCMLITHPDMSAYCTWQNIHLKKSVDLIRYQWNVKSIGLECWPHFTFTVFTLWFSLSTDSRLLLHRVFTQTSTLLFISRHYGSCQINLVFLLGSFSPRVSLCLSSSWFQFERSLFSDFHPLPMQEVTRCIMLLLIIHRSSIHWTLRWFILTCNNRHLAKDTLTK